ncbi:uncharacterized protein LOC135500684 [Lineus longissimus]|uniref:uncharacterized protein LOC135500684 n=1 Tax=Lineus longissimus TaxID=88925 RepID=UPI002B4EBCC8
MAARNSKKLEINEKVKEIKRMQQNWMKQRSDSKEGGERATSSGLGQKKVTLSEQHAKPSITTFSPGKPGYKGQVYKTEQQLGNRGHVTTPKQPSLSLHHTKKVKSSQVSAQNSVPLPTRKECGLDSFTNKKQTNDSLYHNNKDFKDKFRHWLKVKNVPIDEDSVSKVKTERTNNNDVVLGFPELIHKQSDSLSAENTIENLADDIVSRVRNQLYTAEKVEDVPYYKRRNEWDSRGDTGVQPTVRSEVSSKWDGSEQQSLLDDDQYDSHICPVCRQLMVSPYVPMLLIPCGHTGCKSCLVSRVLCPMCGADIKSQTVNVMLHQIIVSHQEERKPKPTVEYSAGNYTSGADYEEEYGSLSIRCEALSCELEDSDKNVEKLVADLSQERMQCQNIEQEEERITGEITQLQESLAQLNMHKLEYKQNCHELELKHSEEVKKVALLQATLHGLRGEMEKVKMLWEGINT